MRSGAGQRVGRPQEARSAIESKASARAWAPLDAALSAFRSGRTDAVLVMRTDVGEDEPVPVSIFFRSPSVMGAVDRVAQERACGKVLELGAGVGAHALPLSRKGLAVTVTEILPAALEVLTESGLADVRVGGLETVKAGERFDTVLSLMNGLGFAATLGGLPSFLASLASVLSSGGQVLADSTDPRDWGDPDDGRYPGEVHMQLEFGGVCGPPFPFLFVDPEALAVASAEVGLACAVLAEAEDGHYLARLARRP